MHSVGECSLFRQWKTLFGDKMQSLREIIIPKNDSWQAL